MSFNKYGVIIISLVLCFSFKTIKTSQFSQTIDGVEFCVHTIDNIDWYNWNDWMIIIVWTTLHYRCFETCSGRGVGTNDYYSMFQYIQSNLLSMVWTQESTPVQCLTKFRDVFLIVLNEKHNNKWLLYYSIFILNDIYV